MKSVMELVLLYLILSQSQAKKYACVEKYATNDVGEVNRVGEASPDFGKAAFGKAAFGVSVAASSMAMLTHRLGEIGLSCVIRGVAP